MNNKERQAGTNAQQSTNDEVKTSSSHNAKPNVACSFSSNETKNYSEEIKEAWDKGLGHTKIFMNDFGQPVSITSFNEFDERVCQEDYHRNIVNQLNKKFSDDNSAKL